MNWYWYAYIAVGLIVWGLSWERYKESETTGTAALFCSVAAILWPIPLLIGLGFALAGRYS